jgi:ketosteroid isomerase-like protein
MLFWPARSVAQNVDDRQLNQKSSEAQRLFDEISRMDSVMFGAYNAHDVEKLRTLFAEDLEFFHDTGGLLSYSQVIAAFKSNFDKNNALRRDLVKGSLEVYPIKDYGAIEIGTHKVCHVENGKDDCGVFKFVHVWQKRDGNWKVTRVVSYGH